MGAGVASRIAGALRRARGPLIASAATYLAAVVAGVVLATAGWPVALGQRDAIVGGAQGSSITQSYARGEQLQAALLDFSSNLFLGAVPTSVLGFSVVGPFPIAAYRGWVGGIVSVDSQHRSRLATPGEAVYYVVTMLLQLAGFVLTMAAGIQVGLAAWRKRNDPTVRGVLGFRVPRVTLLDAGWLYALAVPAFLAGSLWEFMA